MNLTLAKTNTMTKALELRLANFFLNFLEFSKFLEQIRQRLNELHLNPLSAFMTLVPRVNTKIESQNIIDLLRANSFEGEHLAISFLLRLFDSSFEGTLDYKDFLKLVYKPPKGHRGVDIQDQSYYVSLATKNGLQKPIKYDPLTPETEYYLARFFYKNSQFLSKMMHDPEVKSIASTSNILIKLDSSCTYELKFSILNRLFKRLGYHLSIREDDIVDILKLIDVDDSGKITGQKLQYVMDIAMGREPSEMILRSLGSSNQIKISNAESGHGSTGRNSRCSSPGKVPTKREKRSNQKSGAYSPEEILSSADQRYEDLKDLSFMPKRAVRRCSSLAKGKQKISDSGQTGRVGVLKERSNYCNDMSNRMAGVPPLSKIPKDQIENSYDGRCSKISKGSKDVSLSHYTGKGVTQNFGYDSKVHHHYCDDENIDPEKERISFIALKESNVQADQEKGYNASKQSRSPLRDMPSTCYQLRNDSQFSKDLSSKVSKEYTVKTESLPVAELKFQNGVSLNFKKEYQI